MTTSPAGLNSPPLTLGGCAALACIWEATAPKPGNVYRNADFEDTSYIDFLTSAVAIAPVVDRIAKLGIGGVILAGIEATRGVIGSKNTNLGILLLIAPLAAAPKGVPLRDGIAKALAALDADDCRNVYAAIRLTQPGGLGDASEADVNADAPPTIALVDAMRLAADRDLIARQYASNFAETFAVADAIAMHAATQPLGDAIVRAYIELLAAEPDSLIARKCGLAVAREVSGAAKSVLECLASGDDVYQAVLADFDFWLRSDGNRLNPGTSADIIAAALFVLLRERRLNWPVEFYGRSEEVSE
jgi:triphosphoribosyl-dephospho-CoA synthase